MRLARLIIVSILVFAVIITIISLFIPSDVQVSRSVLIHAPKDSVMAQIGDPVKWRDWYPNAAASQYFYNAAAIEGLVLNESKKQFIVFLTKNEDSVMAEYRLPNKTIPTGWQVLSSPNSDSVTVQWYINFHLRWYPWEKFTSFVFEKVYHPQLQHGLDNLKSLLEKPQQ